MENLKTVIELSEIRLKELDEKDLRFFSSAQRFEFWEEVNKRYKNQFSQKTA